MRPPATVDPDWTSDTVVSNGVSLHYLRTGDGDAPPLVIAHGFTDDAACRAPLIRALADDWDVVAYDARGHGRSDAPPDGYGMPDRVADCLDLADTLGLDRPVLLGHSMGGATVARVAPRIGAQAAVLVDPAGLATVTTGTEPAARLHERVARWRAADRDEVAAEIRSDLDDDCPDDLVERLVDARRRLSPHVARIRERGYGDPVPAYEALDCPTLVLRADADEPVRDRDRRLVDRTGDAELVHVAGSGHTVFRDAFEPAYDALADFLDRV